MTEIETIPSDATPLHAIVHLPAQDCGRRVGVLISCSNINPKFGPQRLFFHLGEAMAQAGFHVLRYDNRGTSDSPGLCDLTFTQRVADARAAIGFFRIRYRLDVLIGWGLCMGAAVLVHCTASARAEERLDGLVLCSILAHPSDAWLPQHYGKKVNVPRLARDMLFDGNLLTKLWHAPGKFHIYRKNLPRLVAKLMAPIRRPMPELEQVRSAVGGVGELLAQYPGPCLMIFGEKDAYRASFLEHVNPGDRLGLARKNVPPDWALIKDGDHVFASQGQAAELIRYTLEWVGQFRHGPLPNITHSPMRGLYGVSSPSVAD